MTQYNVRLDAFEGPLDLLLHLINRYEIDIYDIPVSQITEQYLEYIHTMKELQLDVASEYLVMAASLLAIKSKTLLPKHDEGQLDQQIEMEMEDDPREDLVRRLIEYRKFKEASSYLRENEGKRSLTFSKPPSNLDHIETTSAPVNPVSNMTIYDLVGAFQSIFDKKQKKNRKTPTTKIDRQDIPIDTRMNEIVIELSGRTGKQSFQSLFPYPSRDHMVVTFLAILELMKTRQIRCEQQKNFQDIMIHLVEEDQS
ncbi:segregation/condensation protein A [Pseudalkalibacillus berkeleyi]|uniref:Segregation and condensation protein A n=1 Tax=Pseudalkalibacillus berkeleyi TaxID=1069813 RepID=A0ABS9H1I2_9BACL|nr:segregation/condensation protein A [Pseudalkalibacillus berkeleyi]MCF6137633.1 segregation/condensation protein A [Pseudalkalibacillus berkeleyi]